MNFRRNWWTTYEFFCTIPYWSWGMEKVRLAKRWLSIKGYKVTLIFVVSTNLIIVQTLDSTPRTCDLGHSPFKHFHLLITLFYLKRSKSKVALILRSNYNNSFSCYIWCSKRLKYLEWCIQLTCVAITWLKVGASPCLYFYFC